MKHYITHINQKTLSQKSLPNVVPVEEPGVSKSEGAAVVEPVANPVVPLLPNGDGVAAGVVPNNDDPPAGSCCVVGCVNNEPVEGGTPNPPVVGAADPNPVDDVTVVGAPPKPKVEVPGAVVEPPPKNPAEDVPLAPPPNVVVPGLGCVAVAPPNIDVPPPKPNPLA
jgi:hypothetical protein